ncbi:porin family protein [Sphingomonas sabuli]|uniref:Porin family protein n=1 Tax=Sphingomonas sabuli TaxID=2764186 RepID=A0A7G9L4Z3_9SPHN|nr:outer membrane beta-barrel protein [Sphingomonas sabuli]QNM83692.1 porin family protein [Sphingomonas sabuli]
MRKISIVCGAVAAAMAATPAAAAPFTGPRVEVRAGWEQLSMDVDYEDEDENEFAGSDDASSATFGAEAGYDFDIGSGAIAGAYAGVEFGSAKPRSTLFGNDEFSARLGRNATFGVRFGGQVSPGAMLYVKGGYSNGRVKAAYDGGTATPINLSDSFNREGYHVGAGGEVALGTRVYARAEYVRTSYEEYLYPDFETTGSLKNRRNQLLLGVGARF